MTTLVGSGSGLNALGQVTQLLIQPAATSDCRTAFVKVCSSFPNREEALKIVLLMTFTITLMSSASAQGLYGSSSGGYGTGSNPSSHSVSPYITPRGTYVGGHQQTNPNSTQMDNYSTRGNVNPYTGGVGTRSPRY